MSKLSRSDRLFLLITALFVIYGLIFIYTTSFVIGGERYFSLFDDAMISMRYARNFAEGYGLVWNPGGPPVEGYTNPLWVVFMAFWHLFPISASKMSLAIQLSALALLALNLVFVRRIALLLSRGSDTVALIAVLLTALYLPLNNWSLQGMEVAALAPLVSWATWLALRGMQSGGFSPWLYLLLGTGTLIRMDAAVVLVVVTLFLAIADKEHRARHLLYGLGTLLIFGGAQTLFRWVYYGDLLPNTYYLKLEGFPLLGRIARGFYVLGWFVASMSLVVFLGAFYAVWARRDRFLLLLAALFAAQVAYSVYVGGDAWDWWGGSNRYISIVMPLFMVLLAYSLWLIFAGDKSIVSRWRMLVDRSPLAALLHLAILVGLLVWTAVVNYDGGTVGLPEWGLAIALWLVFAFALRRLVAARNIAMQPTGDRQATTGKRRPSMLRRALRAVTLPLILLLAMVDLNTLYVPGGILEWILLKTPVQVHNNPSMVERALLLREVLKPQGSYAVVWAGIIPYFAGGEAIDLLGKNDRLVAHLPMRGNPGAPRPDFYFYPGHMKYDYAHSIGELQPDAIVQFWSLELEPPGEPPGPVPWIARPYVDGNYVRSDFGKLTFFFLNDSGDVRWGVVERLGTTTVSQP
jgi:hypothetical protein